MNDGKRCEWRDGECDEYATMTVRTVLGPVRFCERHGWIVRNIEAEWDAAEAEYYGGTA